MGSISNFGSSSSWIKHLLYVDSSMFSEKPITWILIKEICLALRHPFLLVVALQTGKKLCDMSSPLSLSVTLYYLTAVTAMQGARETPEYPFETFKCSASDNSNPARTLALCFLSSVSFKRGHDCSWRTKFPYSFKGGRRKNFKDVRTQEYLQWSWDPWDLLFYSWYKQAGAMHAPARDGTTTLVTRLQGTSADWNLLNFPSLKLDSSTWSIPSMLIRVVSLGNSLQEQTIKYIEMEWIPGKDMGEVQQLPTSIELPCSGHHQKKKQGKGRKGSGIYYLGSAMSTWIEHGSVKCILSEHSLGHGWSNSGEVISGGRCSLAPSGEEEGRALLEAAKLSHSAPFSYR